MQFKGHTDEWVQNVDQRGFMSDINSGTYFKNKMHFSHHSIMQSPFDATKNRFKALAYILH